ncbi:ABC transporter permease [Sutcliffiella deserti]|uniref:ABC transporter permease n=1 Tax=Sutcliffiella deserti TaxID=2875501 RepID=UPI001CBB78EB|nr:iron ABC transporter permease [Sutcliffiella deserti]
MKKFHWSRVKHKGWALASIFFISIILIPNILIAVEFFTEPNENWLHIKEYLLRDYLQNSLIIILFTALATMFIGTSLAWLVTIYHFPFRNFLKWGLILPLAIPPYIAAYTYHGILNYTGVVQSGLRNNFELQVNQAYFNIMSIPGAIFIFTVTLFPYVYSITLSYFQSLSASVIENARLLGSNSISTFFRVALPIARGAIVGSVTLVILEVLNDYGVASYFGIQTVSTAIFRTWYGMMDLDSALKLAGTLMIMVMVILSMERLLRGRKKFFDPSSKVRPIQPKNLKGVQGWTVFAFCFSIFTIAFIIPVLQLIRWASMTYDQIFKEEFLSLAANSIFVASISALLIIVIALIISNYTRLQPGVITKIFSRVTTLGYSIPGAAIAIAVITIFIMLDEQIVSFLALFNLKPEFVLRTTLVMLVFAYVIRFLAIGFNAVESGFEKVGNKFTEASRTLGASTFRTFLKVDLPLLKGAIVSGFILVFIDILKELPLTLFLQPFNFSTLATQAFKYANDERVQEASIASLLIIFISALSIFIFYRVLDKEGK